MLSRIFTRNALLALLALSIATFAMAAGSEPRADRITGAGAYIIPDMLPPGPVSEFMIDANAGAPINVCSEWNPEFVHNGNRCCATPQAPTRRRRRRSHKLQCAPERRKFTFCNEMTEDQRIYLKGTNGGLVPDMLELLTHDFGRNGQQSYCTVNNGFLVHGRPLVPSATNGIKLRSPERCVFFGTDRMVAMTEWLGRQVKKQYSTPEYSKMHLLVGDISAPRGGCLGHASHTSGLDVDIGYLVANKNRSSPESFVNDFDAKNNWWLIKQVLSNPYTCVKVIFLDKRNIRKLEKAARGDPDWIKYRKFIRHVPAHRNHMHVRIGDFPGAPGCNATDQELNEDVQNDPDSQDPSDGSESDSDYFF
jgi:murein endopeptidase